MLPEAVECSWHFVMLQTVEINVVTVTISVLPSFILPTWIDCGSFDFATLARIPTKNSIHRATYVETTKLDPLGPEVWANIICLLKNTLLFHH